MTTKPKTKEPEYIDIGKEVVHVADKTGRKCGDCGVVICAEAAKAFYPYEHVVVVGGDPCAAWKTSREITCPDQR